MPLRIVLSLQSLFDIQSYEALALGRPPELASVKADASARPDVRAHDDERMDRLNDAIWDGMPKPHHGARAFLDAAPTSRQGCALISEYPALTTNLARSALFGTMATRLGRVYFDADMQHFSDARRHLRRAASDANCPRADCSVLVSNLAHLDAALDLGMTPVPAWPSLWHETRDTPRRNLGAVTLSMPASVAWNGRGQTPQGAGPATGDAPHPH